MLDTDDQYASLDVIRDFFDNGGITVSSTRLSHLRDFLEYIANQTTSMREKDKLFDLQEKITTKRFPKEAFDTTEENKEKEPEYLSDEEIERACAAASNRGELVIRVLFETGLRIAEFRALTSDDVDFDADGVGAAITVDKAKTRSGEIQSPKSEAGYRTVELTPKTAEMLRDWIDENNVGMDGEMFPHMDKTYNQDVKDAFTAAGVFINDGTDADQYKVSKGKSFVSCHWMRHNRNTRLKKERHPAEVQQYMGHENAEMTDHYTHYDPDEVQGIVGGN